MAKPSSTRRFHGGPLILLIAAISVFSLLTHELSRHSAMAAAAEFEGFDADELDFDPEEESETLTLTHPNPTTTINPSLVPEEEEEEAEIPPPLADPVKEPSSTLAGDLWDEDEFEGIPTVDSVPDPSPSADPAAEIPPAPAPPTPFSIKSLAVEIACVSFLVAFAFNYFTGKRQNELIALAWASRFATPGSIFDKNFSLLGTGDGKNDAPLLLKEGQDTFKFYASGRRFCVGLLATMELKSRHDLIMRIVDLVFPKKDTITFEVVMNEDAMDHVVVALARKKTAKAMQKDCRDLAKFGNLMASGPSGRKWVAEELMVVTESKEVAGDMITDVVLDQVFGEKAFEKFGKWFISMHLSDQQPGSHKKILMFKFALPGVNNMEDMTRLVALVPYYIDLIGRYKLSSQARPKTEAARSKAAQEAYKELQYARQEELQRKKAEKKKLMEEAEAKLSAEARRKKEEKERARQLKKSGPKVKKLR
ncbi:Uncharacterized protein M6B38_211425 [Iris pallida]|uniref:Coiled-coil domain-containing protein 47 n=1 Tax=Iris pallida TaxID=29817 RepID=A0AAX6E2M3_IRIPA|nr:Uncharacterized protein M6B38_211425 [Iris pallida]